MWLSSALPNFISHFDPWALSVHRLQNMKIGKILKDHLVQPSFFFFSFELTETQESEGMSKAHPVLVKELD